MKLSNVKLKNFQSHRDTELNFCDGFNVIIGPSDNGKSSIVRAINWVLSNRPRGDEYIRKGTKGTTVSIGVGDVTVSHSRTSSDTGTYQTEIGNKREEYQVLHGDVPQEILSLLPINNLNIQAQLDQHYLILDTPGKVASELNSITKLDALDEALSTLKSDKRKVQDEIDITTKTLDNVNGFLASGIVELIEEFRLNLSGVKETGAQVEQLSAKIRTVTGLINQYNEAEKQCLDITIILDAWYEINVLWNHYNEVQKQQQTIEDLLFSITQSKMELDGLIKQSEIKREELLTIRKQLSVCPYCGSKLTELSKQKLLER